jgi:hypothetical protein
MLATLHILPEKFFLNFIYIVQKPIAIDSLMAKVAQDI